MLRKHRNSGIMHFVKVTIAKRMAAMHKTISRMQVKNSVGELRPSSQLRGSMLDQTLEKIGHELKIGCRQY